MEWKFTQRKMSRFVYPMVMFKKKIPACFSIKDSPRGLFGDDEMWQKKHSQVLKWTSTITNDKTKKDSCDTFHDKLFNDH